MATYAGIGSRQTPPNILNLMSYIGERLAINGFTLNSGGAIGADKAFEIGCIKGNGKHNIFRPENATLQAIQLAAHFHPAWDKCSDYAQRLHARNGFIILGKDLQSPVDFIVCWTPNGAIEGGTGQALRIAKTFNIPVFNLADKDAINALDDYTTQRYVLM